MNRKSEDSPLNDYESIDAWLKVEREAEQIRMKYSGRTSSKKIEQCNDLINSFEKRKDKIKSLSDIAKLELAPKKNLPPKVAKRPPLIPRQKKIVAPMANSPMLDSKIIELRRRSTDSEIDRTLDSLKEQRDILKAEYFKMNINKCTGMLEYIISNAVQRNIKVVFGELVKYSTNQSLLHLKALDYATWRAKEKIMGILKKVKKNNAINQLIQLREMQRENYIQNNRTATDFYQFSLKVKAFDSLALYTDRMRREEEKIEQEGMISVKVESFKETLKLLKQEAEIFEDAEQSNDIIPEEEQSYPEEQFLATIPTPFPQPLPPSQDLFTSHSPAHILAPALSAPVPVQEEHSSDPYPPVTKTVAPVIAPAPVLIPASERVLSRRQASALALIKANEELVREIENERKMKDLKIKRKWKEKEAKEEARKRQLKMREASRLKACEKWRRGMLCRAFLGVKNVLQKKREKVRSLLEERNARSRTKVFEVMKIEKRRKEKVRLMQEMVRVNEATQLVSIVKKRFIFKLLFEVIHHNREIEKNAVIHSIRFSKQLYLDAWKNAMKELKQENFFVRKKNEAKIKIFRKTFWLKQCFSVWDEQVAQNMTSKKLSDDKAAMLSKVKGWLKEYETNK